MRKRVLYLEDNDEQRALVGMMMRSAPFDFDMAADGPEAWGMYREARESGRPYDLLLLDAALPGETGYQFAERIRAGGDDRVLIQFMTAYTPSTDPISAARLRAVRALRPTWEKPLVLADDINPLPRRVASLLAGGGCGA